MLRRGLPDLKAGRAYCYRNVTRPRPRRRGRLRVPASRAGLRPATHRGNLARSRYRPR